MKRIVLILFAFFCVVAYSQVAVMSGGVPGVVGVDSANWEQEFKDVYYEWAEASRPDLDTSDYYNTFIESMKSYNYWVRAEIGYWQCVKTPAASLLNIVDPSAGTYDLVETGAGTLGWTQYVGHNGDGTNYFNSSFNPSTDAAVMSQDDASLVLYTTSNDQTNDYLVGAQGATYDLLFTTRFSGDGVRASINSSGVSVYTGITTNELAVGTWGVTRTVSTHARVYKDGGAELEDGEASEGLPNADFTILSASGNSISATQVVNMLMIFDGMSANSMDTVDIIFNQLATDLGFNTH